MVLCLAALMALAERKKLRLRVEAILSCERGVINNIVSVEWQSAAGETCRYAGLRTNYACVMWGSGDLYAVDAPLYVFDAMVKTYLA